MGVLGHPVDQARGQQQPLQLIGVVVEVERELGHSGLSVAARVLVHARQGVPGGVGDERRVRGSGVHRGAVAVAARVKRDGSLELGHGGQTGAGQGPRAAVQGTPGHFGHAQGRGGVHVAIELAHAKAGLVAVQGAERAGRVVRRGIRDDDTVVVAGAAAGQRGQADGLIGGRTRRGHQGVRHSLAVQRGLPGGGGDVCGTLADQQDLQIELRRRGGGASPGPGRRGQAAHHQYRDQERRQPGHCSAPASAHSYPHQSVKKSFGDRTMATA